MQPQRRLFFTLSALAGLAACALAACHGGRDPLLGRWEGVDSEQGQQTFIFEPGGKARWVLEYGDESQTFDLSYKLDAGPKPYHLDLSGFASGPLAGATLYCIVELPTAETLQLECRPGGSSPETAAPRPTSFGPQTVRCKRLTT